MYIDISVPTPDQPIFAYYILLLLLLLSLLLFTKDPIRHIYDVTVQKEKQWCGSVLTPCVLMLIETDYTKYGYDSAYQVTTAHPTKTLKTKSTFL